MTATTAERIRAHRGPAILALGFRPFFLAGALWAALAMLAWLLVLTGRITMPVAMGSVDWHVHAFLYGYLPAIAAGFLLTAVPNWTGRLPVTGWPLLALVGLWLAGRIAVLSGFWLGPLATAIIDLAFLASFAVVVARELLAGANKRNLPVLLLLTLLLIGNAVFHREVEVAGNAAIGTRLGITGALMLIMLIGGRIVPSFTRNWLAKQGGGRLPAPAGRLDAVAIAVAGLALMSWMKSRCRRSPLRSPCSPAFCSWCGSAAGPASARRQSRSSSSCIWATPSSRSASCRSPALACCPMRSSPWLRSTPGRRVLSAP